MVSIASNQIKSSALGFGALSQLWRVKERLQAPFWLALIDGCWSRKGGKKWSERETGKCREQERREEKTVLSTMTPFQPCLENCFGETWSQWGGKKWEHNSNLVQVGQHATQTSWARAWSLTFACDRVLISLFWNQSALTRSHGRIIRTHSFTRKHQTLM